MAAGCTFQRSAIKIDIAFSAISEVNETLSLTNEPDKLVSTALDTLAHALNIECCWIQTISDRQNQTLSLAAELGFSDTMRAEIASMDLNHKFCGSIIGAGDKIAIPDLNHDGAYGLDSFREEGYRWLVAVPLMTYRVYGLLGAACRQKKLYDKNTAGLIMVAAGLIANALSKAELVRKFQPSLKPGDKAQPSPLMTSRQQESPLPTSSQKPADTAPVKKIQKATAPVFSSHPRKITSYREAHRKNN
jgi:signal transduction protein with GAF and PtsI domain